MKHAFGFIGTRIDQSTWQILDTELFHLEKVLRLKVGDEVELIDGQGYFAKGMLSSISKSQATVGISECYFQTPNLGLISVAIGALKHGAMDEILPGLVELGMDQIAIFRSDGAEKDRVNDKAIERWQRIAQAACKQSKRAWFPKISVFSSIDSLMKEQSEHSKIYFFDELATSSQQIQLATAEFCTMLIVGSEAGLSPRERALLTDHRVVGLRFGSFVMRSTTAAIAAATLLTNARLK